MEKEKKEILMKKYYLDLYEHSLVEQDKGVQTIETYVRNCLYFFDWLEESNGDVSTNQLTTIDIRDYKSYKISIKQSKPSSVNIALNSLKSLISFYHHNGYIDKNIAEHIKILKAKGNPTVKDIPDAVFNKFRREVYRNGYKMHICYVELLKSGLRVSEICNLRLQDIELNPERGGTMTIMGKRDSYRKIPLSADLIAALKEYLPQRNQIPTDSNCLLISERKQGFQRTGLYKITQSYSKKINAVDRDGQPINLSPHMFRHFTARKLLETSDPILVSRILGHSSIQLLLDYYVNVTDDAMEDAINKL